MESWRHTSAGMSPFLCDEIGFPAREVSMGWTMKPFCDSYGTIGSSREVIQRVEYKEKEILNIMGKSDSSNPRLDVLDGGIGSCVSRTLPSSACDIKSNSPFGESESGLSFSSPFSASSCPKSSLVDLNLGKRVDWREAKNSRSVDGTTVFSSLGSSYASKRARTMNLPSQNPTCQVHGCNDDLSSSKDYHKRHRVCDVHSKTATVIVKGIEQRFCQQCSRFHLLAEFDNGKRSCRKRLAGHNERRRKPQLDIMSSNPHTVLQYFEDYRFPHTSQPKRSSFVFPGMLPSGLITSQGSNQCSHVKEEESSNSKLLFHLNGSRKQYCSGKFSTLGTASAVQELPGVSNSSSALSLLSENLSSHLTEIPSVMDHINAGNYDGVSIENSFSSNGFRSSVMNSMEIGQVGPQVFCDGGSSSAVDFQVPASGIFQRSDCVKGKGFMSPEHGPTVDLFQLSSHLQRVEQQRNSMQLKQENDVFCYFPPISGL